MDPGTKSDDINSANDESRCELKMGASSTSGDINTTAVNSGCQAKLDANNASNVTSTTADSGYHLEMDANNSSVKNPMVDESVHNTEIISEQILADELKSMIWSSLFIEKTNEYYGFVASVEDALSLIKAFELVTVTKFVVKKTDKKNFGSSDLNRDDKHRILWDFEIPYIVVNSKNFDCHHGKDHHHTKKIKFKRELDHSSYMSPSLKVRNTKKLGCSAQIKLRELATFPEFKIPKNTDFYRTEYASRVKKQLAAGNPIKQVKRISVRLPMNDEHLEHVTSDKLKAAVHYNVGRICESQAEKSTATFSKKFIAALTETAWKQCGIFAQDLELFARHAKRTTITTDDIKLLSRRSLSVNKHLTKLSDELACKGGKKQSKKAKLDDEVERAIEIIDT